MNEFSSCVLSGPVSADRGHWAQPRKVVKKKPAIRTELVNRIRAEIAAGTYETPEKLEKALAKMLLSIG